MNPFEHTKSIAFELSNFCNLARLHTKCPLSLMPELVTLPIDIVLDCLRTLDGYGWSGVIVFNQYNEPMIDPRLFYLVDKTHQLLPDCSIEIETNSVNLTAQLAQELSKLGATKLHVTLYGTIAERRARAEWLEKEIAPILPTAIGRHALDDRMGIYDAAPSGCTQPCGEPLAHVTVTCAGQVGLCCYDWKRTMTFGDLHRMDLPRVLGADSAQMTFGQLMAGDRQLDVCQRCNTARC